MVAQNGRERSIQCWIRKIAQRVKDTKDTNALAVVDRKIQQIKKAISGRIMEEGEQGWKALLPDVVKALNETPTDALQGKSPEDIDDVAAFDLQKVNAEKLSNHRKTDGAQT